MAVLKSRRSLTRHTDMNGGMLTRGLQRDIINISGLCFLALRDALHCLNTFKIKTFSKESEFQLPL